MYQNFMCWLKYSIKIRNYDKNMSICESGPTHQILESYDIDNKRLMLRRSNPSDSLARAVTVCTRKKQQWLFYKCIA